jgi:uncharacterized protein with PIN domain
MVVDTSAILALLFKEKHSEWVAKQMNAHALDLQMSTVTLAETLILIEDRQRHLFKVLEEELFSSGIKFIAPDIKQSQIVAKARLKYPLNLGDCFVYALAVVEKSPILTVDKDFKSVDLEVLMP